MHSHNASPIWRKLYVLHRNLGWKAGKSHRVQPLLGVNPHSVMGFFWVISLLQHNASTAVLERFPAGTTRRLTRASLFFFRVAVNLPVEPSINGPFQNIQLYLFESKSHPNF